MEHFMASSFSGGQKLSGDAAVRQTQVSQYESELLDAIELLTVNINNLETSLKRILRDEPAVKEPEEQTPLPMLVPLAANIRSQAEQVKSAGDRINQIRLRIEL